MACRQPSIGCAPPKRTTSAETNVPEKHRRPTQMISDVNASLGRKECFHSSRLRSRGADRQRTANHPSGTALGERGLSHRYDSLTPHNGAFDNAASWCSMNLALWMHRDGRSWLDPLLRSKNAEIGECLARPETPSLSTSLILAVQSTNVHRTLLRDPLAPGALPFPALFLDPEKTDSLCAK